MISTIATATFNNRLTLYIKSIFICYICTLLIALIYSANNRLQRQYRYSVITPVRRTVLSKVIDQIIRTKSSVVEALFVDMGQGHDIQRADGAEETHADEHCVFVQKLVCKRAHYAPQKERKQQRHLHLQLPELVRFAFQDTPETDSDVGGHPGRMRSSEDTV